MLLAMVMKSSSADGSRSVSLLSTVSASAPCKISFTGTSTRLPESVRGMAATSSMRLGAWRGDNDRRKVSVIRFRISSLS